MVIPLHSHLKCIYQVEASALLEMKLKYVYIFPSVLHTPLLLSDSRLHLFLQSDLSMAKIEKCALGKTRYTVAEAIQLSNRVYISRLEDKVSCDSDCERYELWQNGLHKKTVYCV